MTTQALQLRGLSKTYKNGPEALKGIDLDVREGDFFALLGPNGAGKSTTIGIISSLITKSAGTVKVFGADLDRQMQQVKTYLGVVPQEFNFNMFEQVRHIIEHQAGYYGMPRPDAKQRTQEVLEQLGLWDKRASRARDLSGGMKRRLMIARALVHKPRLLILDEPTAGVDIEIRRSMWKFLREINQQGTTIILTTHYLEEAESLCRNIAIINHGKIVEDTDMKTLLGKLHIETFVLNLRHPLQSLPEFPDYTLRQTDDTTLEVDIAKTQNLNALFSQLAEHDIEILSMRNKSNRLEELFVRLVEQGELEQVPA